VNKLKGNTEMDIKETALMTSGLEIIWLINNRNIAIVIHDVWKKTMNILTSLCSSKHRTAQTLSDTACLYSVRQPSQHTAVAKIV
jgi:hypothetical protein